MISELLRFLKEDIGGGDITTEAAIIEDRVIEAEIIAKENGILAGLDDCEELLMHFNFEYSSDFKDGDSVKKGDVVLKIKGKARSILTIERLLLNILMRMSGIATLTNRLMEKCRRYGVTVAGTRKTAPGFRYYEKKAIEIGGGWPHRQSLADFYLIKDNHIALVGLEEAIKRARAKDSSKKIEVEVSSIDDAFRACELGIDMLMLDNMHPKEISKTIKKLKDKGFRDKVKIELSGGITERNIDNYAKTKPDIISMGALTTDVKWLDMSLRVKK